MAITYRNGVLCAEGVALDEIARRVGTPCYVYSREAIEAAYREFSSALSGHAAMVAYSVKANSNLAILSLLARCGAGFDIVSGGELARVQAAGGDARKVLFSGVGKSEQEIVQALEAEILCLNVESEAELDRVAAIAARLGRRRRVVDLPVVLLGRPEARTHVRRVRAAVPGEAAPLRRGAGGAPGRDPVE